MLFFSRKSGFSVELLHAADISLKAELRAKFALCAEH